MDKELEQTLLKGAYQSANILENVLTHISHHLNAY